LVDYVRANIREKLQLETLASQACMSKAHFVRTFKQELGLTPMDFVMKERLKVAKMYLATGGVQIQEVSHLVGFASTAYFIRAFKKEFQVTPKVFQTEGSNKEKSFPKF
jgi:transcriptional regulator GlxA family with amidase domain